MVETVSLAADTVANSDEIEVDAVKSIFVDVIDDVIRRIKTKFKENNLDERFSVAFLTRSNSVRMSISEASTQTGLVEILKPYVSELKMFTAKGFQVDE